MDDLPLPLIEEMTADLYLNIEDGSVSILHSDPFTQELLGLEYNPESGILVLKFTDKDQEFGMPLLNEFKFYLVNVSHITLLQINMSTKETLAGIEAPLTIVKS